MYERFGFEIIKKIEFGFLLTSFAVFIGALYLMSYWYQMGVNIFGHLKLSDFVTSAIFNIYPLLSVPLIIFAFLFADDGSMGKVRTIVPFVVIILYIFSYVISLFYMYEMYEKYNVKDKDFFIYISIFIFLMSLVILLINIFNIGILRILVVIFFIQISLSIMVGSVVGLKKYHENNGMILKNSEICDGYGDWYYLNTFGETRFFIEKNSKDICLTDSNKLILKKISLK